MFAGPFLQHPQIVVGIIEIAGQAAAAELMAVVQQHMVPSRGADHRDGPFRGKIRADRNAVAARHIDMDRRAAVDETSGRGDLNFSMSIQMDDFVIADINTGMIHIAKSQIAIEHAANFGSDSVAASVDNAFDRIVNGHQKRTIGHNIFRQADD